MSVFFSYDTIRLRLSEGANQLYSDYKYSDGSVVSTFDEMKAKAIATAKNSFHAPESTIRALETATIQNLLDSATASHSVYFTCTGALSAKTDVILTLRALAADSDTARIFYTWHLAALGVPPAPSKQQLYDTVSFWHGPMYADFEAGKAAVLRMCGEANNYLKLYEQAWGISKDVTNIGKWRKGFEEDFITPLGAAQKMKLDVFRVQTES